MTSRPAPVPEPADPAPAAAAPVAAAPEEGLFPGGGLPAPESPGRRRWIRFWACAALLVTVAYLTWRAGFTLGRDPWVAVPMWLLELHAGVGLGLFAFSLWDVDASVVPPPVHATDLKVGLLIPTYNEPREILFPTVAAAVALEPAHETVVLDDGRRPWVRQMAAALGASYMTRPDNANAKAGNLNHALDTLDLDVVGVLDADHIARAGFLTNTLGYFDDPGVAAVQTPQDFYNLDSFEHDRNRSWLSRARRPRHFSEQGLFYRVIQPGKNRWQAAFWCGTNAVVRVSALREVGGVAHETLTEDMHTTIRLHRQRWRTIYHNEVLAHGLAARDAAEYQAQRLRWGTGAMQILRLEKPFRRKGLKLGQKLAYAATILGWFDAWRTLGYVLVPFAVLFSGATPVHAPMSVFLPIFAATFLVQRLAMGLLTRGHAPQGMATVFEFVRMQSNLRATLALFGLGEKSFKVTTKGGSDARRRVRAPRALVLLIGVTVVALTWFGLTLGGLTPLSYDVPWTAYGAAFWATVNLAFLCAALGRIRSDRFASERRSSVRLQVGTPARVSGHAGRLVDVSTGGAMVRCDVLPAAQDEPWLVEMEIAGIPVVLHAHERGRQTFADGSGLLRMQFADDQVPQLAKLATALFGAVQAARPGEAGGETGLLAA